MSEKETFAPFWEHIDELRKTIISIFFAITVGFVCSFAFHQTILNTLTLPFKTETHVLNTQEIKKSRIVNSGSKSETYKLFPHTTLLYQSPQVQEMEPLTFLIPQNAFLIVETPSPPKELVFLGPLDGILSTLKVCFWVGLVGSSPFWLYFLFRFIAPALQQKERHLIYPFLGTSTFFLSVGFLFAFFLTIPLANQYLLSFNQTLGTNLWAFTSYIDYTIILLLANGLAFETAALFFFLVHFGVFSAEGMRAKRYPVIVAIFILSAILTPPDVLTQLMLAIPLIAFYEAAILYAFIREKKLPCIDVN